MPRRQLVADQGSNHRRTSLPAEEAIVTQYSDRLVSRRRLCAFRRRSPKATAPVNQVRKKPRFVLPYDNIIILIFIWLESSASLASLTRETGPNVVKGDPARKTGSSKVAHMAQHQLVPTINISDSSMKFTHVLYNLSPAGF